MSNVVPMRARAPWTETNEGKLLAQWKWALALNSDPNVTSAGKHVALYLLDKFDESKGYAFPGYARIMKANGIGRKGAMAAITSLEENGWFRVRRFHEGSNGTGGPRTVNHYYPVWGRAAEIEVAAATQSPKDTAPSLQKGLLPVQADGAKRSFEGTGQSEKRTGQYLAGDWGSTLQGTGAVSKRAPDSTYSTYSTHHPAYDPAYAPEVSGGGRASAPSKPGSASRSTGTLITADWHPSPGHWAQGVAKVGDEAARETLDNYRSFKDGDTRQDPDSEWLSWCEPF